MSEAVRIGELSMRIGLPISSLRRLADEGRIPSERTPGGHRIFDPTAVMSTLAGEFPQPQVLPARSADWTSSFGLPGLDESRVWQLVGDALGVDTTNEAGRIAAYGFTEMLNNAIDHSGGARVSIEAWSADHELSFRIADDGRGVFDHLRAGLGLASDLDAIGELTKGKRTTMPERHTGEGIFFTSKVVGVLRLAANGLRMTVDNLRGDTAVGVSAVRNGTVVEVSVPLPPLRSLRSVFDEFTDDGGFTRSRPTVKLFGTGLLFISRSEARRVMEGMTAFDDIDIDFAGVEDVGQGFVDEILRVWPSQHPGIRLHPIHMNEAVEFMVRRAERRLDP